MSGFLLSYASCDRCRQLALLLAGLSEPLGAGSVQSTQENKYQLSITIQGRHD